MRLTPQLGVLQSKRQPLAVTSMVFRLCVLLLASNKAVLPTVDEVDMTKVLILQDATLQWVSTYNGKEVWPAYAKMWQRQPFKRCLTNSSGHFTVLLAFRSLTCNKMGPICVPTKTCSKESRILTITVVPAYTIPSFKMQLYIFVMISWHERNTGPSSSWL
jgi:hypothetical protein